MSFNVIIKGNLVAMNNPNHSPHKKYDVILLAGEGESSYKVYHQHKAFLEIKGKCIIN